MDKTALSRWKRALLSGDLSDSSLRRLVSSKRGPFHINPKDYGLLHRSWNGERAFSRGLSRRNTWDLPDSAIWRFWGTPPRFMVRNKPKILVDGKAALNMPKGLGDNAVSNEAIMDILHKRGIFNSVEKQHVRIPKQWAAQNALMDAGGWERRGLLKALRTLRFNLFGI